MVASTGVLVVGGGLAGTAAALALAGWRRGHSTTPATRPAGTPARVVDATHEHLLATNARDVPWVRRWRDRRPHAEDNVAASARMSGSPVPDDLIDAARDRPGSPRSRE